MPPLLSSSPWEALARSIAAPWPDLQNPDGTFPDYVFDGEPGFSARYGESMLGYGLLLTGVREDDDRLIEAGLLGLSYAVGRSDLQADRPSVFENLAVAAGQVVGRRRLADHPRFAPRRREWEHWLRKVGLLTFPWVGERAFHRGSGGQSPARLSIARAIRALALWKP